MRRSAQFGSLVEQGCPGADAVSPRFATVGSSAFHAGFALNQLEAAGPPPTRLVGSQEWSSSGIPKTKSGALEAAFAPGSGVGEPVPGAVAGTGGAAGFALALAGALAGEGEGAGGGGDEAADGAGGAAGGTDAAGGQSSTRPGVTEAWPVA